MDKPENVYLPDASALSDSELAELLKKLYQAGGSLDPIVEAMIQRGAVVRPETAKERKERLRTITPGQVDPSKVYVLRQVTDEEFGDALNKSQGRCDPEMWPKFSSRAWLYFRRLRGDLREGRTELKLNPDGTVSTKNLPPLPQFPSIRTFRPNSQA